MPVWIYFVAVLLLVGALVDWRVRRKRKGLDRMVGHQLADDGVARAAKIDPGAALPPGGE